MLLFYNDLLILQSLAINSYAPQNVATRRKPFALTGRKGIRTNRQEFSLQVIDFSMSNAARLSCYNVLRQTRLHHFTDILLKPRGGCLTILLHNEYLHQKSYQYPREHTPCLNLYLLMLPTSVTLEAQPLRCHFLHVPNI